MSDYPEGIEPKGQLALRTLAMPADANPSGDIFGGWMMAQMDIAGGVTAEVRAKGRVATVAVDGFTFHEPVFVGDVLCCYADIQRVGKTSVTIMVEAWVLRRRESKHRIKVTDTAVLGRGAEPTNKIGRESEQATVTRRAYRRSRR